MVFDYLGLKQYDNRLSGFLATAFAVTLRCSNPKAFGLGSLGYPAWPDRSAVFTTLVTIKSAI